MLKLSDINSEIQKLEQHAEKPNCTVCQQLAWLYTIRDHMTKEKSIVKEFDSPSAQQLDLNIYSKPKAPGMSPRLIAEKRASKMQNEDGTQGPHWTMELTKQVQAQQSIECDPIEFFLAMNMMYSDYVKVAKKLGVNNVDFYSCMAKAFLDDKDAGPDKLERYFEYVVGD